MDIPGFSFAVKLWHALTLWKGVHKRAGSFGYKLPAKHAQILDIPEIYHVSGNSPKSYKKNSLV